MNQGTRWVLLMQKNRRRKSHAWAPLSWPKVGLLLLAGELPWSHVVLLSVISSTWIAIKNHVHALLVQDVRKSDDFDVRLSFWADSSTYVQRATVKCLRLVLRESKMAKKSSRVSHTSSRMVRACCLRSPPAGLRSWRVTVRHPCYHFHHYQLLSLLLTLIFHYRHYPSSLLFNIALLIY